MKISVTITLPTVITRKILFKISLALEKSTTAIGRIFSGDRGGIVSKRKTAFTIN